MIILQSQQQIHVRERSITANFNKEDRLEDFKIVTNMLNLKQHDKIHEKLLKESNAVGKVRRCRVVLSDKEKLENKLYLMSAPEIVNFISRVYNVKIKNDPKNKLGIVIKAIKIIKGK